ncbi:hypothetical protein [Acidovorax sp. RAC01]|uniref:hypothetical protein n=1 Tax=Acidovorax sp. RAC01 TaxID=1842533 RepID=UPI00085838B4|nr:hypothetical protein [Acidovorax sp. RAC01]AOG21965.1 hypothetical protein BSY15_3609 [Acidovorax sp. RAC01]
MASLCIERVTDGAPTTQYAHNGLGQRVFKTEPLYSPTGKQGSAKNLNNLLADDEDADQPEAQPQSLIEQLPSFFLSKALLRARPTRYRPVSAHAVRPYPCLDVVSIHAR